MAKRDDLIFFDKIINVTFYQWVTNPDNKAVHLEAAFTIRSDRPFKGFNYFEAVRPPTYEDDNTRPITEQTADLLGKKGTSRIDSYGVKPSIRLQLTQLPETVCTNVTVTIENLTLEIDISKYTAMYIEAGYSYSNGNIQMLSRFYAGIFSSYVETPNPSGRTVFTGIVGNWFVKGVRAQPYTVSIAPGSYKLRDFIAIICSYLGVIPQVDLPDNCLNYPLIVQDNASNTRAQSGYQVLDWLANELSLLTKEWRANNIISQGEIVGAYFYNNVLFVNLASTTRPEDRDRLAVSLNRITTASYQGGALYITAPWNPLLLPGILFHMNPVYFRGRMMPNLALSSLQDDVNLYRPITIDVMFETVSNVNQMKILAVAARIAEWNAPGDVTRGTGREQVSASYVDDGGELVSISKDAAQEELLNKITEEAYDQNTAAYYPGEDPYAIGLLVNYPQEVEKRKQIATDKSINPYAEQSPMDIFVRLDQDAITRWYSLIAVKDDIPSNGGNIEQPNYTKLEDPARSSSYQGSVDTSLIEAIPFESEGQRRDWGSRNLSSLMAYMWEKGILAKDLVFVDKARGSVGQVHIIDLIQPLSAVASAMKYQEAISSGSLEETTYKEVWWGNLFNFVPAADSYTNDAIRSLFPAAYKEYGYTTIWVPKITSPDDLKSHLDAMKSYLEAAIEYWTRLHQDPLSFNDPGYVPGRPADLPRIRSLQSLLAWHEWTESPWRGWNNTGHQIDGWRIERATHG